jgi:hypothetical protein
MAAVARTVTSLSHTAKTTVAANPGLDANVPDGDLFPNNGSVFVIATNTGGSTYTVTEAVEDAVDGDLTVTGRQFSLTAGEQALIKLGPPKTYGAVTKLTASNVAVKFAAYRV